MFESGEHVLVSCKQTGIRISRLWLGMVPIRKVCDWPRSNPRGLEGAVGICRGPAVAPMMLKSAETAGTVVRGVIGPDCKARSV